MNTTVALIVGFIGFFSFCGFLVTNSLLLIQYGNTYSIATIQSTCIILYLLMKIISLAFPYDRK